MLKDYERFKNKEKEFMNCQENLAHLFLIKNFQYLVIWLLFLRPAPFILLTDSHFCSPFGGNRAEGDYSFPSFSPALMEAKLLVPEVYMIQVPILWITSVFPYFMLLKVYNI